MTIEFEPEGEIGPVSDWAVVRTHQHKERIAAENLSRQRFETYSPTILRRIRHARKVQDLPRPMFPGYIFLRPSDASVGWRSVSSTFGVRNLMCCGDKVSLVSDEFVRGFKAREVDGLIVRPNRPYSLGQSIRIAGGPFDGLVATIIEMDERERLVVLLQLLNGSIRARVDAGSVREVGG